MVSIQPIACGCADPDCRTNGCKAQRQLAAPSSNGKTADFESANRGSSPRGASTRPKGWSKRKWKNWKYQRKFQARAAAKQRVYMVFREGGGLPTVTYSNMGKAIGDATALAKKHRGEQFHVLASTVVVSRPALAAAASGGDVKQAPAESPQSGGEAVTPNLNSPSQRSE